MNFDTVITKENGIQAMQYLVNNVNNGKFIEYSLNYLYAKYLQGFINNQKITEGVRTMINLFIELLEWVESEKPTYLVNPADLTKIRIQFAIAYNKGKLCTK